MGMEAFDLRSGSDGHANYVLEFFRGFSELERGFEYEGLESL